MEISPFMGIVIRNPQPYMPREALLMVIDSRTGNQMALLKDVLVVKILLYLRHPEQKDQMNTLSILAQDEKFMNTAQGLQKDFNRIFDFAINLRTSSLDSPS